MDYLTKLSDALRSLGLLHGDIEKIGSQIETAASEYKTNRQKDQPTPVVNAVLHRPQAEIDQENSRAARHETRDTNRLRLETWGVVVGAIVAFATLGQLYLTKRAVNIAAISADAAQKGAAASQESVSATRQSIESSVNAIQLDQRAWISASINLWNDSGKPMMEIPAAGQPLIVRISYKNSGKTPALHVKIFARREGFIASDKFPSFEYGESKYGSPTTIPPDSNVVMDDVITRTLVQSDRDKIFSKDWRLYVHGRVAYDDVFGKAHITEFCSFLRSGGGYELCARHNGMN